MVIHQKEQTLEETAVDSTQKIMKKLPQSMIFSSTIPLSSIKFQCGKLSLIFYNLFQKKFKTLILASFVPILPLIEI